ncbi:MAG: glycosyltransferase [Acidisphaera sp.]|nr:glycosyltransferase [Acidisphaera sp.]MBV9812959.1 glycosyltransferase [Acetobacteraceae bacterium]
MIEATAVSLLAWLWLLALRGRFWRTGPTLMASSGATSQAPDVDVVVPARDEAAVIGQSIGSLRAQDYRGRLRIVLVDDDSSDGTAETARAVGGRHALTVVRGTERPRGWAGKLWAVHQGLARTSAPLVLLTDADIVHDPAHVSALVAQAERSGADLVSEMVALRCESLAERALVPAFVYFFALLYPFAWVNDARRRTAAAAGGTMLLRRQALARVGGVASIRGALIDDVALGTVVKRGGKVWLGHSGLARSVRPYPGWADVWRMVARSAYVQLRCSPLLLAATIVGLSLLFLVPPLVAVGGDGVARWLGVGGWAVMAGSFLPMLRRYRLSPLWAPLLPAIALFYMAATIGSAIDHHRGRGVAWRGRAYAEHGA